MQPQSYAILLDVRPAALDLRNSSCATNGGFRVSCASRSDRGYIERVGIRPADLDLLMTTKSYGALLRET